MSSTHAPSLTISPTDHGELNAVNCEAEDNNLCQTPCSPTLPPSQLPLPSPQPPIPLNPGPLGEESQRAFHAVFNTCHKLKQIPGYNFQKSRNRDIQILVFRNLKTQTSFSVRLSTFWATIPCFNF